MYRMWSKQQQKTSPMAIMTTGPEKMKRLQKGKNMMVLRAIEASPLHESDSDFSQYNKKKKNKKKLLIPVGKLITH